MIANWRADQVGSFLRPPDLLKARQEGLNREQLSQLEDQHILRVLQKQKDLGFDIFTDGELRRRNFMSDFTDAVSGFDLDDAVARKWEAKQEEAPVSRVSGIVTSRLKKVRPLTGHEVPFLRENSPGAIKVTLPSATQFPAIAFRRGITDKAYASHSELLWDIVAIMKTELEALASQGVQYIQIDAPRYSYYIDPKWREWISTELGVDPEAAFDEAIQADNTCFRSARINDVTLGIHLCRGNNRSHWYAEGGYDAIAEKLFSTLDVDRFLLEYDDERSGTFEPLRFIPRGKTVVLGLISSKRAELENPNELIRQIAVASRYIPLENLALSPQCGFASTMEGNLLTEEQQWKKLQLVVETARIVWK
jgi:5-methyltetrahydropteroyltriglutamate--homocysteine methyltransferase